MKAQQKEDQKFKLYRLAQIMHYRVDKMLKIQMSEEEREGKEWFRKLDVYKRQGQCINNGCGTMKKSFDTFHIYPAFFQNIHNALIKIRRCGM